MLLIIDDGASIQVVGFDGVCFCLLIFKISRSIDNFAENYDDE
jgi:hypothetical protein